ncbi:MAG: four helix bundle protein [Gemmatimonadales bacterium]
MPDAFEDAKKLTADPVTSKIAPQLYAAVCGIEANIGEAYSRTSGKDRALTFEYALGEVRESMSWYNGGRPVLGDEITNDRLTRLEEMRRILLAIIRRERRTSCLNRRASHARRSFDRGSAGSLCSGSETMAQWKPSCVA